MAKVEDPARFKRVFRYYRYIEADAFAQYLHEMSLKGWHRILQGSGMGVCGLQEKVLHLPKDRRGCHSHRDRGGTVQKYPKGRGEAMSHECADRCVHFGNVRCTAFRS